MHDPISLKSNKELIDNHKSDSDVHITKEQKESWDTKADGVHLHEASTITMPGGTTVEEEFSSVIRFDEGVLPGTVINDADYLGGKSSEYYASKDYVDAQVSGGHTHANESTLNQLSDSNGSLQYGNSVIVDEVKLNAGLSTKVDKISGKSLSTNDYTSAEKTKLSGIATGANKYVHPASHPASIVTQDASNRFVTDAEKTTWNNKASTSAVTTTTNGLMTKEDKTKLNGISANANNYSHPANHPASIITQDTNNRFVTDAEKSTWNGKETTSGAQTKANTALTTAKAYTDTKIADVIGGAPDALNTLKELGDALAAHENEYDALLSTVGAKAEKTYVDTELGKKANSSHGTHVSYGGNGSATTVSRSDHSHAAQTSVTGNAGTATKLATSRTINGVAFDGTANITVKAEANGGTSTGAYKFLEKDTRSVNENPQWYMTNNGSSVVYEFKTTAAIGLKANHSEVPTYAEVSTYTSWKDSSGGIPVQLATCNTGLYYRTSASTTAWNPWLKLATSADVSTKVSPTGTIVANRVATFNDTTGKVLKDSGFTIATSVPSDAKFTDTVYTHPNDANTRHVTDEEKTTWNGKASTATASTTANGLMASADKTKLDGIATGANKTAINNTLTSTSTAEALSAAQGKALKDLVDGKAATSHGTHVSYGGNGTASTVSRSDHSHAAQTSVSGNAGTATKLATARTINGVSFDGSANITVADSTKVAPTGTIVSGRIATFNDTTGKVIKDSGFTIATSVPANAKFTDTVYTHPTTTGNKHIPSGGASGQILRWSSDGTATWGSDTNTWRGIQNVLTSTATDQSLSAAQGKWLNENKFPGYTINGSTAATSQWYRIAQTSSVDQANTIGVFNVRAEVSGKHSSTVLTSGITYGKSPMINQLSHTAYSVSGITKARIVYHATYSGNRAYLEVFVPDATARSIKVELYGNMGWTLLSPSTVGSIPTGYSSKEITLAVGKIVSDINGSVNGYTISKSVPSTAVFTDTVYTHPSDANTRHVTDAEKATWNGKANAHTHPYSPTSHNHDTIYATKSEVSAKSKIVVSATKPTDADLWIKLV